MSWKSSLFYVYFLFFLEGVGVGLMFFLVFDFLVLDWGYKMFFLDLFLELIVCILIVVEFMKLNLGLG